MDDDIPIAKRLYDATKSDDLASLQGLIDADVSRINVNTPFGSLLHVAADEGHMEIVKYLVEAGADINLRSGILGGNPLNSAASNGQIEIVMYLIQHGAEMDVSEPTRNPLFGAIYGGYTELAEILIKEGIDTSIRYSGENMNQMNALAFAKEWGRLDIVRLLENTLN